MSMVGALHNALIILGFGQLQWYRKRTGGLWECYWNGLTHSHMWFHGEPAGYSPFGCYGDPLVEDYRVPKAVVTKW